MSTPRTLILTAYDSAMAPIGDLTSPLMLDYANRQGFDFKCVRQFDMHYPERKPYWQKVDEVLRAFYTHERVIWLDSDQLVTSPEWTPPWQTGFRASLDWGSDAADETFFSACGFVVCRDMIEMFLWLKEAEKSFWHRDFPEQTAMRHYKEHGDFRDGMSTEPRRTFNAVPKEICEDAPEPWQKGDFCAHLTHVEIPRRAELFHEIRRQCQ